MSKILIKTINGEFTGELDKNAMSDTIWLSLPKQFDINMLGSMIYFECPLKNCDVEGEQITELSKGDIAYWPNVNALCFFFGPTPLSKEDGGPVAPYPVIKIGRLTGKFEGLENAGDRQKIRIERAF